MENTGVVEKNKTTKFTKLLAVSIGHFSIDFYMNLIPPILFLFTNAMNLTLTQQATIAFVITSSGSFAQPIIGHFVDKFGKPWLMILSVAWISLWMSISGIITNYYLLLIVLGMAALASALFHPMGSAAAMMLGNKAKGRSLSIFMTIGGFAMAFPPLIALPIVQKYGLSKLIYFIIPGFIVSGVMYFSRVHEIEFSVVSKEKSIEKKKLDIFALKWVSILVLISTNRFFIRRVLLTFGIQLMLLKNVDVMIAGFVLSSYLFLNSAGTIIGGLLNDRIGSKNMILLANLVATVCIVAIYFTTGIQLIVAFIIIGFSLSIANTADVVMTHDLIPHNINMGTGLIIGVGGGVSGLGILVYGKLADIYGLVNGIAFLIIPLVIVDVLTMVLPGDKKIIKS